MLTVKEAKEILFNNVEQLPASKINVQGSLDYVLSENIYSLFDIPPFNQSAMDGFAVYIDLKFVKGESLSFPITAEIQAGGNPVLKQKRNTAISIYTGAPTPHNTTCVVMQEKAEVKNNVVTIPSLAIVNGSNIRLKGSQIKKGVLALSKGLVLNPAAIGFLCTMGLKEIKVIAKPVVSILATGNELQKPGTKLLPGQIYESNSFTIDAALRQTGFNSLEVKSVADNEKLIFNNIKKMLSASDVVIISGGISVGKYDLVKDTLTKLGVKEIFYKVSQKPGKPLYAGKLKNKIIFALPGNPAASLVCFYEYVLPVVRKMSGHSAVELKKELFPLTDSFEVKGDRELFLKAKVENGMATILDGQESNILKSFAEANAIVYLPAGNRKIEKGKTVETHLLP